MHNLRGVFFENVANNRTAFDLADFGAGALKVGGHIHGICIPNGHDETSAPLPTRVRDTDFVITDGTTLITWTGESLLGIYQIIFFYEET